MSIFGDAKSYYVKNSSVNSVIIYIRMNILKMNLLDFPSLKKQLSAMRNYLRWRYFSIWTCTYVESTRFLEPVCIAKVSRKTLNLAQKVKIFLLLGHIGTNYYPSWGCLRPFIHMVHFVVTTCKTYI